MRRAEDFRLFGTRPILWAMKLIMPITFVRHAYAQMNVRTTDTRTDRRHHHMASIDHRPLFRPPRPSLQSESRLMLGGFGRAAHVNLL